MSEWGRTVVCAYDEKGKLIKRRWPTAELIDSTVKQMDADGYRVEVREWKGLENE